MKRYGRTIRFDMKPRQSSRRLADRLFVVLAFVLSVLIAYIIFRSVITR